MTLKSKHTSLGLVEIQTTAMGYGLYLNGVLKQQSADLNSIMSLFEKY